MILLSAQNISKTYMERKVLDDVSFFLNEGDKVGIIGINGTGKSTLLKILAGAEESDSGDIVRTNGIRISYLPQIPEFDDLDYDECQKIIAPFDQISQQKARLYIYSYKFKKYFVFFIL